MYLCTVGMCKNVNIYMLHDILHDLFKKKACCRCWKRVRLDEINSNHHYLSSLYCCTIVSHSHTARNGFNHGQVFWGGVCLLFNPYLALFVFERFEITICTPTEMHLGVGDVGASVFPPFTSAFPLSQVC